MAEAPFDYWVATEFLSDARRCFLVCSGRGSTTICASHSPLDLPVDNRRTIEQAALALRERGCQVAVTECVPDARALARMKRVDEAAREFERTFADPGFDCVLFANEADWLVDVRTSERKNIKRALELAEEAAKTWSWLNGLEMAGYLYERLGRAEDAEEMYERIAVPLRGSGRSSSASTIVRCTNGRRPASRRAGSAG